jgi:hypothetical protein
LETVVKKSPAVLHKSLELKKVDAQDRPREADPRKNAARFDVVGGAIEKLEDGVQIAPEGKDAAGFGEELVAVVETSTESKIFGAVVWREAVPVTRRDRNVGHQWPIKF